MPFPMPNIHISFKPHWPIVPMNNMLHKGPLRNIYTPTCPTDISQKTTMDRVLVLKVLSGGRHKTVHHNQGGGISLIQLIALQLYMLPPPHHTTYVHTHGELLTTAHSTPQLICAFLQVFLYWHSGKIGKISF